MSSSSDQPFIFTGASAGERDFNRKETATGTQPHSSSAPPQKKRINQPANPNPDAEVIALSPKTLMAANRFICQVCNKGFQREQNLQLHMRGHSLPWKLKHNAPDNREVKRKVLYLCPEPTCVHHDPSRALGDLTSIKKHYYRKHGEKKWKCDKCCKRYNVQSDWRAHSKTCGTEEYRCDCGTLFSRRDSFITHRAFCEALAQETARHPTSLTSLPSHHFLYGHVLRPGGGGGVTASRSSDLFPPPTTNAYGFFVQEQNPSFHEQDMNTKVSSGNLVISVSDPFHGGNAVTAGGEGSKTTGIFPNSLLSSPDCSIISAVVPSHFGSSIQNPNSTPHMSATELLQKAAQMGSTSSSNTSSIKLKLDDVWELRKGEKVKEKSERRQKREKSTVCESSSKREVAFRRSIGGGVYGENDGNLHDLMNSFSDLMKSPSDLYGGNKRSRDFLGKGQIVRSMSGGGGSREPLPPPQQHRRELSDSDEDGNSVAGGPPTSSQ